MQDRPDAQELIATVAQFLSSELAPTVGDARLRFRTLIAANVLAIVGRELAGAEPLLRAEWQRLAELLDEVGEAPQHPAQLGQAVDRLSRTLSARIRGGALDDGPGYAAALAHAEQTVLEKLQIVNPKFVQLEKRP